MGRNDVFNLALWWNNIDKELFEKIYFPLGVFYLRCVHLLCTKLIILISNTFGPIFPKLHSHKLFPRDISFMSSLMLICSGAMHKNYTDNLIIFSFLFKHLFLMYHQLVFSLSLLKFLSLSLLVYYFCHWICRTICGHFILQPKIKIKIWTLTSKCIIALFQDNTSN